MYQNIAFSGIQSQLFRRTPSPDCLLWGGGNPHSASSTPRYATDWQYVFKNDDDDDSELNSILL